MPVSLARRAEWMETLLWVGYALALTLEASDGAARDPRVSARVPSSARIQVTAKQLSNDSAQ